MSFGHDGFGFLFVVAVFGVVFLPIIMTVGVWVLLVWFFNKRKQK